MKTLIRITVIVALLFGGLQVGLSKSAENINDLLNKAVYDVDANKFKIAKPKGFEIATIHFDFAQNEVLDLSECSKVLDNSVHSVKYVYSGYASSSTFDQKELDLERLTKLKAMLPELFDDKAIKWHTLKLTGLENTEQAEEVFHGFIILYNEVEFEIKEEDLLSTDAIETQQFITAPSKQTNIVAEWGTKIEIKPNSFVDANGKHVKQPVRIKVKEVLSSEMILLSGLKTVTTDNQLLESGGMVYVDAFANGEKVFLADNASVDVKVPTLKMQEGMQYFEGVTDESGDISWANPQPFVGQGLGGRPGYDTSQTEILESIGAVIISDGVVVTTSNWRDIMTDSVRIDTTSIYDNWIPILADEDPDVVATFSTTMQEKIEEYKSSNLGYSLRMSGLGWANCDRFYRSENSKEANLFAKLDDYSRFEKIEVFLIFADRKISIRPWMSENGRFTFAQKKNDNKNSPYSRLPVGDKAVIIAKANIGEEHYFDVHEITISEDLTQNMTLQPTDIKDIKQTIADFI